MLRINKSLAAAVVAAFAVVGCPQGAKHDGIHVMFEENPLKTLLKDRVANAIRRADSLHRRFG